MADRADASKRGGGPCFLATGRFRDQETPSLHHGADPVALGRTRPHLAAELRTPFCREHRHRRRAEGDRGRRPLGRAGQASGSCPRHARLDPLRNIDMATLDADAERVLDLIRQSGRPPYETLAPAEARELYRKGRTVLQPDPPDVAEVSDLSAPGPAGPIRLRRYRGAGTSPDRPLAGLIYFHGGGWVFGDLDTHDVVCRKIANAAKLIVIAVDYRLAPEAKFPAAVEGSAAAPAWVAESARALGVDRERLAVGGDSAGGNLAAVVALA